MTIADILDKAADKLEPEGAWIQGDTGDRVKCFCLASALGSASGSDGFTRSEDFRAARRLLVTVLPQADMPLVKFNDAPGRTQAEVVSVLREAAALAREQGQ